MPRGRGSARRAVGSASSKIDGELQPTIGWMPFPASFSENSSAPKRLLVSVSATAGCRSAAASSASSPIFSAPSSSE